MLGHCFCFLYPAGDLLSIPLYNIMSWIAWGINLLFIYQLLGYKRAMIWIFLVLFIHIWVVALFLLALGCRCVLKNVSLEHFFCDYLSYIGILVDTCWWRHSKWVRDQPKAKTKNWLKGLFWSKISLLSYSLYLQYHKL